MEFLRIYFKIEKAIVNDGLKQMMHNKLKASFDKDRNEYLIRANKLIEADNDISNQVNASLKKDRRRYESFTFESNITVQNNDRNYFLDFPIHEYQIKVKAKSFIYICLKIIDGSTFVVIDPSNNEIITLKREHAETVYFHE